MIKKTIQPTLELIEKLVGLKSIKVNINGEERDAIATYEMGNLYLEFTPNNIFIGDERDLSGQISFEVDDVPYTITEFFLNLRGSVLKGRVFSYKTTALVVDDTVYKRVVIPYNNGVSYFFKIEDSVFETEKTQSRGCLVVKVENTEFHVYRETDWRGTNGFLIIDCTEKVSMKFFNSVTFSIIVALGYVTGSFVQDYEYVLFFKDSNFGKPIGVQFDSVRNSIKISYQPINSNPHAWIDNSELADLYVDKLNHLTIVQFNNLVNKIFTNDTFRAILLSIIEGCSQSLLVMTPTLFVAIESMARLITEDGDKIKPIPDKKTFNKIRDELLLTLDCHKETINQNSFNILKRKIFDLNTPTNRDSLKKAFELLGIELNEREIKILEDRNSFLHGKFSGKDVIGNEVIVDKNVHYIALSSYVLCSALILKYIGFSGHLINFPKVYEGSLDVVIDEEHFRRV